MTLNKTHIDLIGTKESNRFCNIFKIETCIGKKLTPIFSSELLILGPRFDSFGECSNPCKSNPDIEAALNLPLGTHVSECRWNENGPCADITQVCHGSRDWVVQDSGESDPEKCIFVRI